MRLGLVAVVLCALVAGTAIAGSSVAPSSSEPPVASEVDERTTVDPSSGPAFPGTISAATSADGPANVTDRCPGGPTDSTRATLTELERDDGPGVVEVHPNPTTHGNVGEFFVVVFPEETHLENWTVTDGHATASLPNETVSGRIAFSMDPEKTGSMTADRVLELEGHLRLAADGDDLELRDGGRVVDSVSYDRAPTGDRWYRSGDADGVWWPKGATCLSSTTIDGGEATAFVLPDSPDVALETLASAEDRILLAGYTYTSAEVTEELLAAADRGVEVTVLLEAGPVGGTPEATEAVVDELADAGVTVRVLGGADARYSFHHPKYAVVDDRAMVLSENWKPSGIGGTSSRGWGVVVDDPEVAGTLTTVFEADAGGWDTTPWEDHREDATFVADDGDDADHEFEPRFEPEAVSADAVEVLLAPDNAEKRTLELLESAEESIRIKQVRIEDREFSLLAASLEAARRGVEVEILLDSTWYVEDENRELADELERTAEEESLPLEVRLVEPDGRFGKIHAKGVVIDEEVAVVGSPNWNEHAFRENREVALVLHGEAAGSYYAEVFDADWDDRSWPLPLDLVGIVALGLLAAGIVGYRYVAFDARTADSRAEAPQEQSEKTETDKVDTGTGERLRRR